MRDQPATEVLWPSGPYPVKFTITPMNPKEYGGTVASIEVHQEGDPAVDDTRCTLYATFEELDELRTAILCILSQHIR